MDPTHLVTFPLFQGLTPNEIKKVERFLRRQSYPAGNILLSAEQPGEVSYLIIEGTVKVHLDQADGTNVILAILGPGEIVGEMSLIESQPRAATVMGQLEEARLARVRGLKVAQKNGSMKTAFGRFKDFIVGNF